MALPVAILGQLLLAAGWRWAGTPLLLAGVALWWHRRSPPEPVGRSRATELGILAAITLAGGFVRFWRLNDAPPGLMLDEGRAGLCALALLRGDPVLPFVHVSDTFSLFPDALLFKLFGPSVIALRAVPAFWGTLTIPVLWWFLRPLAGADAALVGAGFLAVSRWHVALSRVALSCVQYPLAMVLAAGLFLRAWESNRLRNWVWLGLALGAGFHAYVPGRILPLLFAFIAAVVGMLDRPAGAARTRGLAIAGLVAAVSAAVFGWYLVARPDLLGWRFGEVAGETPARDVLGRLGDLVRGLTSLNWRGDGDLGHSFPAPAYAPMVGWLLAALWIPGLISLLRHPSLPARVLIGAWLLTGFSGAVFGGPHTFRMGALVPLAAGCAGIAAAKGAGDLFPDRAARYLVLLLGLGAAAAGSELWLFVPGYPWGHDPDALARSFRVDEAALANRIVKEAARRPVYLGPEFARAPGTDIERFAAATIFLCARAVHWRTPGTFAELSQDGGGVVFPLPSDVQGDLMHECYPHGVILIPHLPPGILFGPGAYLVGTAEARDAKISLAEYGELAPVLGRYDELFARHRYPETLSTIDAAIARWPQIGGLRTRRGRLMLQTGRVPEAEADARAAIARGAKGAQAWLLLANALGLEGKYPESAEAFARTIRENPVLEDAWYNRIVTLLRSGQRSEAVGVLRGARARFPRSNRLAAMAGDLLR